MTAHAPRRADHPIAPLFLDRWSPRAYTGEAIARDELLILFEAARWAPSAANSQPWRFVYALRDTPPFEALFGLLSANNRRWAGRAAALVAIVSERSYVNDAGGRADSRSHSFDTGAAWGMLALQAVHLGWRARAMGGVDFERARVVLHVPETARIEAFVAIGRPTDPSVLPPDLQAREAPNHRRPLSELVFEGAFPQEHSS